MNHAACTIMWEAATSEHGGNSSPTTDCDCGIEADMRALRPERWLLCGDDLVDHQVAGETRSLAVASAVRSGEDAMRLIPLVNTQSIGIAVFVNAAVGSTKVEIDWPGLGRFRMGPPD